MRRVRWMVMAATAAGVFGCGGGPEPAAVELTPEVEAALKIEEAVAAGQERAAQKRGERETPVDTEQRQADQEERAHRRELSAKGER